GAPRSDRPKLRYRSSSRFPRRVASFSVRRIGSVRCDRNRLAIVRSFACSKATSMHKHRRTLAQYVLLIYQGTTPLPGSPEWSKLSEDEQRAIYLDYAEVNKTPGVHPGLPLGLPERATTVRVVDAKPLTRDGPFGGVPHAIGGFFVFDADDLDATIELAARIPAARLGGAVEIRPVETYW